MVRTDITLTNKRGQNIVCSHFEPLEGDRQWEEMPCVVYMHGNSSCRLEALECVQYLLPANITLFCFDFPGCGLSDGEYISLGWYERDDVDCVINYLRAHRKVSTVGLWGRSMGSVTALLHGDRDPSIAGMILDSPFSSLKVLVNELAKSHTKVPGFLVSSALALIRKSIQSRANFDIEHLTPIKHVSKSFIPALFAAANQDDFIQPHHAQELHDAYAGDKNLIKFDGDHNSGRPGFFHDSAVIFFINTLQVNVMLTEENSMNPQQREAWKTKME